MKAVVYTLGCKVNRTESEGLMEELSVCGYEVSDAFCPADLYIINTCAVTADAESKSRQAVSKAHRLNKNAKIIVIGCAAQNDSKQFKYVYFTGGTAGKRLDKLLSVAGIKIEELPQEFEEAKTKAAHTRAFIKIQDGCDNFCSYCIVPVLRGRSRSRGTENIIEDIKAQTNVKEIVLTGINISKYGLDTESSLAELVRQLKPINKRLRLGSLEVGIIDDGLLSALAENTNFCPHFHLSLQSCSDTVLRRMNRRYGAAEIFAAAERIRRYFPDAGITADIIAGFPQETEAEHTATKESLAQLDLSDIHVFPFSSRPGTAAANMEDLPFEVKKRRAAEIAEIRDASKARFLAAQSGKIAEVLTEKGGTALTKNYTRVYLSDIMNPNIITTVKLTAPYKDGMKGETI